MSWQEFPIDTLLNGGLALMGLSALLLALLRNRWGPVLGLLSQPLWFAVGWRSGNWSICFLCFGYAAVWGVGIWKAWFAVGQKTKDRKGVDDMELYNDKELECVDCQEVFTFTAGEQEFYAKRKFQDPKRCAGCRLERKERRDRERDGDR